MTEENISEVQEAMKEAESSSLKAIKVCFVAVVCFLLFDLFPSPFFNNHFLTSPPQEKLPTSYTYDLIKFCVAVLKGRIKGSGKEEAS